MLKIPIKFAILDIIANVMVIILPLYSLYLNPLDFFIWNHHNDKIYTEATRNIGSVENAYKVEKFGI